MTVTFNRVFDMEQAIVTLYKEYIEATVPNLQQAESQALREADRLKAQLKSVQREDQGVINKLQADYEREVEKVGRLTERLESMNEELAAVQDQVDLFEQSHDKNREIETLKDRLVNLERMIGEKCPKCTFNLQRLKEAENLRKADSELIETLKTEVQNAEKELQSLKDANLTLKSNSEEVIFRLRTEEENSLSKAIKETEAQKREISALESEKTLRETELIEIKKIAEQMETTNSDLIRRLEMLQSQVANLSSDLRDSEEDSNAQKAALEKAQILVKKLNEECENRVKELKITENRLESAKKENRSMERSFSDMAKKAQEVEILKKTEDRLRQEISSLKEQLEHLREEKEFEISDLHSTIERILDEKAQLEAGLNLLEEKLVLIEDQNSDREKTLQSLQITIKENEAEISAKSVEIRNILSESEEKMNEKEAEIALYKRQAENAIRYYQNLSVGTELEPNFNQSRNLHSVTSSPIKKRTQIKLTNVKKAEKADENKENCLIKSGNLGINAENLALQLEEAINRENLLKKQIGEMVTAEGDFLTMRISHLNQLEAAFRPEVERWIMRNEELEQRLIEILAKNAQFMRLLQDCQKTVMIKNRQMLEQKRCFEVIKSEFEATIDFLLIELQNREKLILDEFLPKSQSTLSHSVSSAHIKIQQMNSDFLRLKTTAEEACELLEREKDRSDSLLTENQQLIEELRKFQSEFQSIEELLTQSRNFPLLSQSEAEFEEKTANSEGKAAKEKSLILRHIEELLAREVELGNELIEKRRIFQELNLKKRDEEALQERYKSEIASLELAWKDKEAKWSADRVSLSEEIRQIKLIAQQDSEAKLGLQGRLEAEVEEYRREIEELHMQVVNRNSEAVTLHKRLSESQKHIEALSSEYEIAKSRLLSEIENMEFQLANVQEELQQAKMEAKEGQLQIRSMAAEHENTVQTLHAGLQRLERNSKDTDTVLRRDFQRPKSVLATYQALSGKASPYESPRKEGEGEGERLVQELYVTKAALKKREDDLLRAQEEVKAAQQGLMRKSAYISDLEQQIDFFRSRKDGNAMFLDTDQDTFKMEEMKAEPQSAFSSLEDQLNALKKKRESEKRSFQKRVKEFELILRYLEDQINKATQRNSYQPNPKMQNLIAELGVKNSTLDAWLKVLTQKLENYSQIQAGNQIREKRLVGDVAAVLISAGVEAGEMKAVLDSLGGESPDFDRIARDLVNHLRSGLLVLAGSRHHRSESFGSIKAVMMETEHADQFLTAAQKVSMLERLFRERASNLLQVSTKADLLVTSVRHLDMARPESERYVDQALDMFQKLIRSFQNDLNSDLLHLAGLGQTLNAVLASSPEADSSQIVTISSYHRRNLQMRREDTLGSQGQAGTLLEQIDRLNTEMVRH